MSTGVQYSMRATSRITARRIPLYLVTALAFCAVVETAHAQAGNIMFPSLGVSDKPQSKLWYHDNSWWAAMNGTDRIGIYELAAGAWSERDSVGPPSPPILMGGTTDVLWNGTALYIAAFDSAAARLYKYTYVDSTRDYVASDGFPVLVPTGPGSETVNITQDGSGRLWSTTETNFNIEVRYTTTADSIWAGPVVLGTLVAFDDIASIIAFDGKVGVLWSNQSDWAFYFRYHNDGDPPDVWSPTETVIEGVQVADDHINLACDASGRIYGALKDQYNRLLVSRRNLDGTWTTNRDITYGRAGTRPIVLVDDSESKIYCFYTRWPSGGHIGVNPIEYRVADFNTLVFGVETLFLGGGNVSMNNVQSTKQRLPSGSLLAICDGDNGFAYWNGWGPISGVGGTGGGGPLPAPPPAPSLPSATQATAPGGTLGVAAFTFEEGTGSTSLDVSGSGHIAQLAPGASPDWGSGVTGGGLVFNGINDVVNVSHSGTLSFTGSFTIECWVKLLSEADKMGLINKGASGDRNYRLMFDRGGSLNFSYKDAAGNEYLVEGGAVLDMDWHHVAGVRDVTTQEIRLYLDGQLVGSRIATAIPATSNAMVNFGARQTTLLKDYLHGVLDQVRISSTAVYTANFSPPVAFTTAPTKYVKLTWTPPNAQGGIQGYNVFRRTNGSLFTRLNGFLLVSSPQFTDATALDGFLDYRVSAVDLLGQEGPQSPTLAVEFESHVPLPPDVPQAYAVTRHTTAGGVVAGYPLDENSGQTATDAAGNANHGFLGSSSNADNADPLWKPGITGSCLEFDGSNDIVTIPDAEALRLPGSMTIEAWIQLAQTGRTGALVAKGPSGQRNYRVIVTSSGKIEFTIDPTSGSSIKITSSGGITDLAWHHVACVYDAENEELRVYIDGILAGSTSASGTPVTSTDPVYFGARRSSSSLKDYFKGRMDLVQISAAANYSENFSPPTSLGGSTAGGYVTLRWNLPVFGLVYGYNVYRSIDAQFDFRLNSSGLWTQTTYVDDKPHPGENCYWVRAVNAHGVEGTPTQATCITFGPDEVPTDAAGAPSRRGLQLTASPNPFNPSTRIAFEMAQPGSAELDLYDVAGRRVQIWHFTDLPAGMHRLHLEARTPERTLASGIYFLRLRAGGEEARTRLVLLK